VVVFSSQSVRCLWGGRNINIRRDDSFLFRARFLVRLYRLLERFKGEDVGRMHVFFSVILWYSEQQDAGMNSKYS
jgi:hypothetical protein